MPDWPKAILFDFDGVIVNSEPLHYRAFAEVALAENIDLSPEEYYGDLIGFDDSGVWRQLFLSRDRELDAKTFHRLMTHKSEATRDLILQRKYAALPGVEACVRGLRPNYPLAICSGAAREEIEAMLDGIALRDCFEIIVAAEDVAVGKPDPSGYLLAMNMVSQKIHQPLEATDCLVIEDAPKVIESVKRVGFSVLGVATSYPPEGLSAADRVVPSLEVNNVQKAFPQLEFVL